MKKILLILFILSFNLLAQNYNLLKSRDKESLVILEKIIKNNTDVNTIITNSVINQAYTPLIYAIMISNTEIVKELIKRGADVNKAVTNTIRYKGINGESIYNIVTVPIVLASSLTNLNILKELINNNADINIEGGRTLLFYAQDKYIAAELIKLGIDVNAKDTNGKTALFTVGYDAVEKLVSSGAQLEVRDNEGNTPLLCFINSYNIDYKKLEILVKIGANINAKDNNDDTLLINAIYRGNIELIKKLLELGADIEIRDKNGNTPLMIAIWQYYSSSNEKDLNIIIELVNYGADIYAKHQYGITPYKTAEDIESKEILNIFNDR
ncbi:ankyrin repeat domain-containing protein [Brachyspira pilosicoli]|uniref:Ankyrin repeat-containing protein n=1 Tax=Brachyspira pilosicoli B2904 TaxID=1133568 RepID=J9TZQ1_BRAPL|nr:ankyrin repeat domain-containing protein [Brachyspira pilosicoli]AFR71272.1 ankyrin repeat-containing protein [Brachyspira pilosicoli B2904]